MIALNVILSACLATVTPEPEDSIRTEQVQEVIVTSNSARQRVQNVQMGEEVIQIEDLTSTPNSLVRTISCVRSSCCQV